MWRVLDGEKFVLSDPPRDPFECPLVSDKGNGGGGDDEDNKSLTVAEQKRLVSEAVSILEKLERLADEDDVENPAGLEMENAYERIKEILSQEEKFKEPADDIRMIRDRLAKLELEARFGKLRRRHFLKTGCAMLRKMAFHLNEEDFEKVNYWNRKLDKHIREKRSEFGKESCWLGQEASKLMAVSGIRKEFFDLNLEISGTIILDKERQELYLERVAELEAELARLTGAEWEKTSQPEIEDVENKIRYYRDRIRPRFLIINGMPYEIGRPVHGVQDLTLADLDEDFAHFDFKGEEIRLMLPKILSVVSEK
ncbi:MAG: hypothetical protein ACYS8W_15755 [Planctomycetota bacterium]|jgi:hypothetical protein